MKRLVLALICTIALVVLMVLVKAWEAPPASSAAADDKRPHVETALPVKKTVYRKLNLPGDVLPYEEAAIYARVQGYVESIAFDRGSSVKAGDVLARLSVPELEKDVAKLQAELALCAPMLSRAAAERDWHEAIWKRLSLLAEKTPNLVNQESLDDARGRYEMAKAEVEIAKAKGPGARAALEKAQVLVDLATLKAPFDGVVTHRWVDPGNLIQPATTKILHVVRTDPVRVRIHLSQRDIPSLRADSRAKIAFDEFPGQVFEAVVARQFWALNLNTKTMAVEFDLNNSEHLIRPGTFAHVSIDLDSHAGVLVLPASSLVTEKKKEFLFVVRDGAARKVPVKVGYDDGIEFEVSEGITETDEVIVTGKNLVSDGEKVRTTRRQ